MSPRRCGSRETIWAWEKQHEEFAEAYGIAKACQEALLVELGAVGALNPSMTIFALKNLQGWKDKIEETHKRSVVYLRFDAQDEEA